MKVCEVADCQGVGYPCEADYCCFHKDYKSTPILKGAIATITYISKQGYNQISRLRLTSAVEENLREVLNLFLGFHLGSQLKSLEFLEKINGNFLTYSRRFV